MWGGEVAPSHPRLPADTGNMEIIARGGAAPRFLTRLTSQRAEFASALRAPYRARSSGLATVYAYLRASDGRHGRAGTPYYIGVASRIARPYEKHKGINRPSNEALVRVLRHGISYSQALLWEAPYIGVYGRISAGTGRKLLHNRTDGGEGIVGMRHSQSTKEKIGAAHRGRKFSPELCAKMSQRLKGKKISREAAAKSAASRTGLKRSQETRQKLSERASERAKCPEWRAKISAARTGQKASDQARENMRRAQLGKKQPPEVTAKIRAKNLGRKHTEEAKARMSKAQAAKIAAAALKHGVPPEVWRRLPVNARSNWPRLARERGLTVSEFIQTQLHRPCIRALLPQGAAIAPQRTTQGELHLVPA